LASKLVLAGFVSLLMAWFLLCQFAFLIAHYDSSFGPTVLNTVERNIAIPAFILLLFATVVTMSRPGVVNRKPVTVSAWRLPRGD
jgi:hypothetical protein